MEITNFLDIFNNKIDSKYEIKEETINSIEVKVMLLLQNRVERYTMGDSTSIPVEVAERLLNSIYYSLRIELRNEVNPIMRMLNEDLNTMLKSSWVKIENMMKDGLIKLEGVKNSSSMVGNISYKDTLDEIAKFFKIYDYRFFADEISIGIDYQLAIPVSEEIKGIQYINEYLSRLLIENKFCANFNNSEIINLLNSYCVDYKGLLINIFEPVLTNAIGLCILEDDIFKLNISSIQRKLLLDIFKNLSPSDIEGKLIESTIKLCSILEINVEDNRKYIEEVVLELCPRIVLGVNINSFENLFLSFKDYNEFKEEVFIDNKSMDDDKLREIIKEISSCRYISDKILIVKREVCSISDLIEILNECFWDDESIELFKTLTKDEIFLIKKYLDSYEGKYFSNTSWEMQFIKYCLDDRS